MNITKLILVPFIFFIFGSCKTTTYEREIPVYREQREIVNLEFINRTISQLDDVIFYLSSPVDINTDELRIVEEIDERGIVIRRFQNKKDDIKITIDDEGNIIIPLVNKDRYIDVFFNKKNVTLSFIRISNDLVNRYELNAVKIGQNYYAINFPYDSPYLVFHSKDERSSNSTRAHIIQSGNTNSSLEDKF